jgi:hypothetical protein
MVGVYDNLMCRMSFFMDSWRKKSICNNLRAMEILLDQTTYDLKQTPRTWYSRLSSKLIMALGFQASKEDTSLLFYTNGDTHVFVLVYVDDIIVASSLKQPMKALLQDLHKEFALKT